MTSPAATTALCSNDIGMPPCDPLRVNMTSSLKPELHNVNVSQRRQRRTEPRPQVTGTKQLVKLARHVVLDMLADRQTVKQTDMLITCHFILQISRLAP